MKKLNYEKFMEREVVHAPYERELSFYEWVKQGDVEKIRKWADETEGMGSEGGMGVLSQNPVRNISYHIIISIAMITRLLRAGWIRKLRTVFPICIFRRWMKRIRSRN